MLSGTKLLMAVVVWLLARSHDVEWFTRTQIAELSHQSVRARLTPHQVRALDFLVQQRLLDARRASSPVHIVDFRWEYRPSDLLRLALYSVTDQLGTVAVDVWRLLDRSSSSLPVMSIARSVSAGRPDALVVPLRALRAAGIIGLPPRGGDVHDVVLLIPYPTGL